MRKDTFEMKSLVSTRNKKNAIRYGITLKSRGIKFEECMDAPHHPNDYLIKVSEGDYSRAMKILYPGRDTPHVITPVVLMTDTEFKAKFGE